MAEADARLIRCFSAVFPALSREEIRAASIETVSDWDSLAAVRLVAVLEEEFGLQIDLVELQEMNSFASIRHFLMKRSVAQ
ncbi:MAG: acyl carrier protein [Candidatus Aureabacteria bacterium]|nr:acyl carrier protein [Candidatus Auribacterota bacterium]